jgi:protein-tyrosine phosphatase
MPSTAPVRILFVCLGNICRSPLAHGVCQAHVEERGLTHAVTVDSAGTAAYHVGEKPDPGSIRVGLERGVDIRGQRARAFRKADFEEFDFIVAMDRSNVKNIEKVGTPRKGQVLLFRDFEPAELEADVPDPWGHGPRAFAEVFDILEAGMPELLEHVLREMASR